MPVSGIFLLCFYSIFYPSICADFGGARLAWLLQVTNDVVVWDRIVRRKKDAHLKIAGAKNKYAFRDFSRSFQ